MKSFDLIVNKRIEVIFNDKVYKSLIQDVGKKEFVISIPMHGYEYLPLEAGDEVEVIYYLDKSFLYQFTSKVIARRVENKIPQLIMEPFGSINKVQRRDHVRVSMAEPIRYIFTKDDKSEPVERKAYLLDISGGGMRVSLNEKLYKGDSIKAVIPYRNEEILVCGRIVRVEDSLEQQRIYGVAFTDINQNTREKIIRMVFEAMRRQRELY